MQQVIRKPALPDISWGEGQGWHEGQGKGPREGCALSCPSGSAWRGSVRDCIRCCECEESSDICSPGSFLLRRCLRFTSKPEIFDNPELEWTLWIKLITVGSV